jgi:hypothetical protein
MTARRGSKPARTNPPELRDRLLDHFQVLRIPLTLEQFERCVARAEREGLSHLEFLVAAGLNMR